MYTNGYLSTKTGWTLAGIAIAAGLAYVAYKGIKVGKKSRKRR